MSNKDTKGPRLSLYILWHPEYAQNGRRVFCKDACFRSAGARDTALANFDRYYEKHKNRIALYRVYEHPGNQVIRERRATASVSLWRKYKPQYQTNLPGTHTKTLYFGEGDAALAHEHILTLARELWSEINRKGDAGECPLWQARIYENPGNQLVFHWDADEGEIQPGDLLAYVESLIGISEAIDEAIYYTETEH